MDELLWDAARSHLQAQVEKFMQDQRVYMTQRPDDFKEATAEDFLIWFIESF